MVVGARRAGLSSSETNGVSGFSRKTMSGVYRELAEKKKIFSVGENAMLMLAVRGG